MGATALGRTGLPDTLIGVQPVVQFLVYATVPYLGAYAGARLLLARGADRVRPGRVTAALTAVVAVPSLLGLLVPGMLQVLQRDADRIADGQVWRLLTALLQQDGGVLGLIGNLVALLVVGSIAEQVLGGGRTAATFVGVGLLAQLPAMAWQPVGAGNSVANFGLAGAVALAVLLDAPHPGAATAASVVTLLVGIGLTAQADVHGPAILLGAASLLPRAAAGRRR